MKLEKLFLLPLKVASCARAVFDYFIFRFLLISNNAFTISFHMFRVACSPYIGASIPARRMRTSHVHELRRLADSNVATATGRCAQSYARIAVPKLARKRVSSR